MKLAMKDQSWLGCSGHNINLVLAHGLREAKNNENQVDGEQAEDFMSDVVQLISVCKGIVAHVKRSKIQSKLETTVKQAVAPRWNSVLFMLQSVLSNAAQLKKLADEYLADEYSDKKLQRPLLDVNMELLKQVVNLLEHFDAATRMLSADLKPSLHLVKKMQAKPGDSRVIVELKSKLTNELHSRYSIKPLHVLAALLDSRMKTGVLSAQVAALRCLKLVMLQAAHSQPQNRQPRE